MLNEAKLKEFITVAGDHLQGDWILLGAALLPLLKISNRATNDIDFVGITKQQQLQTLPLLEIADKLGLPIETINQASSYFLQKIPNYQDHLILLHTGKAAKIYRPNLYLFLALKISRLTETDLSDCLAYIGHAKRHNEFKGTAEILKLITESSVNASPEKKQRLKALENALKG